MTESSAISRRVGSLGNEMSSSFSISRSPIVADKASSPPGYGATKILIRKDHIDSGRYKSPADFKGMTFAMNAPGASNTISIA